jgi:hypothetical protein
LFGARAPLDLAKLRDVVWAEQFPAQEVEWEGQPMQAVKLPVREPAWMLFARLRLFASSHPGSDI